MVVSLLSLLALGGLLSWLLGTGLLGWLGLGGFLWWGLLGDFLCWGFLCYNIKEGKLIWFVQRIIKFKLAPWITSRKEKFLQTLLQELIMLSVSNEGAMVWRCGPPYHVDIEASGLGGWLPSHLAQGSWPGRLTKCRKFYLPFGIMFYFFY